MAYNKETGMYEGYIYCIENLINGKKYIGQTTKTINQRWKQHLYSSKNPNSPKYPIHLAIIKYGNNNFTIKELEKHSYCNIKDLEDKLNEREIYLIKNHKDDGYNMYNITSGGNSSGDHLWVPVKQYSFDGKLIKTWDNILSAEESYGISKGVITECCRGKINFCNGYIWRYIDDDFDKYTISDEAITRALSNFKIKQYDFYGNMINVYNRNEIIELYKSSGYHQIVLVCKGKKDFYNNYIWKYEFDDLTENDYKIMNKNITNKNIVRVKTGLSAIELGRNLKGQIKPKMVNCYTMDGNYIKTYNSIKEAGNEVQLKNPYNITLVCTNKRSHAGGYKWFYSDDQSQPDKSKITKNS